MAVVFGIVVFVGVVFVVGKVLVRNKVTLMLGTFFVEGVVVKDAD